MCLVLVLRSVILLRTREDEKASYFQETARNHFWEAGMLKMGN